MDRDSWQVHRSGLSGAQGGVSQSIYVYVTTHVLLRGYSRWCWAGWMAIIASCSYPDEPTHLVRDSAGVIVVESTRPSEFRQWEVDVEPMAEFGASAAGDGPPLFRVADAIQSEDGEIFILNAGGGEVLVFGSRQSAPDRIIGRRGDGPGEFYTPTALYIAAPDTLIVADFGRISYFSLNGSFIKVMSVTPLITWDRFADGSFVAIRSLGKVAPEMLGYVQDSTAILRVRPDDSTADTLTRGAGDPVFRMSTPRGINGYPAPFGPSLVMAASEDELFIGEGTSFSISVFSQTGGVRRIIRRQSEARSVTGRVISAFEEEMLANASSEEQVIRYDRLFESWEYPGQYPAYDTFVIDDVGYLWVRHYRLPGDTLSLWSVFDRSGQLATTVHAPVKLNVTSIGSDYVLGVFRDSLDVETVRLYALRRR